mmetsp:Transcript_7269/g.14808  ORF Transcript_7269/g.14808 Transcript_7269/m.14808 type:complete len:730 (-) Transcript_7269:525-2714(-)|eukprot:CAMPEP_0118934930 /NCGR_PEP_ID=MMETSP1169-20130426/14524_1 /TAXON_ID=36882 /ORGANISM="Pyramimonas obovata, Strain CCMP722" /LENGTH=729 /DNA_ID=CAMNT_0006877893 /DNA_START=129 /DNA_END=2318 /DNA_ORIENTATION=-
MAALLPAEWAPPFDLSPDAIAVLDTKTMSVVHVNKQFTQQIAPAHRAVGLSFVTDFIQPSDRPTLQHALNGAYCAATDDSEDKNNSALSVNTLIIGALSQYPIYRAYDWQFTESRDGKLTFCWGRLVTKLTAERLKVEAEFQDFFDNAPIAMHWLGGTGNVIWANKMEMNVLGYTPEEYIGQPITKFCPDEEELVLKIFHNLGTGNSIHDVPVRFRKKDGRIQHLLIDSNVNWNVNGTFNHTRCFIRDDTERLVRETRFKLKQEQLKELSQVKESLLRKVIHEVRTPCHQIASNIDALEEEDKAPAGADPSWKRMTLSELRFAVQRLSDLMEDVGDTLMLQEQMLNNFKQTQFKLAEALSGFASQFDWFRNSRVRFSTAFQLDPCSVLGYEHGLFRVLRILLQESITKTSDGEVSFTVTEDKPSNTFTFILRDTRASAEQDSLELSKPTSVRQAWQTRAGDTNVLHEDGSQLGLSVAMAKHYLQQMGSSLVSTVSDDMVLTVQFQLTMKTTPAPAHVQPAMSPRKHEFYNINTKDNYIMPELTQEALKHFDFNQSAPPVWQAQPTDATSSSGESSGEYTSSSSEHMKMLVGLKSDTTRSVLIVEDNKVSQMCAERALKKLGVLTTVAENGREAIDILEANPFGYDLVLMDIRMPVMDGIDCTAHIRKVLGLRMPIIAFTAEYSQEMKDTCMGIGMDDFLSKPANAKEFKNKITKHLDAAAMCYPQKCGK